MLFSKTINYKVIITVFSVVTEHGSWGPPQSSVELEVLLQLHEWAPTSH